MRYVQRSGLTLDELAMRYLNVAILAQPSDVPRIIANDADDDHVLPARSKRMQISSVSCDHHLLDSTPITPSPSSRPRRRCRGSRRKK